MCRADIKHASWLAWFAGLGVLAHALAIHGQSLPYTTDELQYFAWSRDLKWGFFSKPPGIAVALWIWSKLDPLATELRLLAQVCYSISLLLSYKLMRDDGLSPARAATASLVLASTPLIGFAQWFFTTDALLLIFWLLALAIAWRALRLPGSANAFKWWLLLGIIVALGVLSKHSMLFFWVGMLAYLVVNRSKIHDHWRGLLLCMVVFIAVLTPHMIWLLEHPGTTVQHLIDLQGRTAQPSPLGVDNQVLGRLVRGLGQAVEFLAAQWLGLGIAIFLAVRIKPGFSEFQRWLFVHSVTVVGIFVFQAIIGRANANWALPATFTLGLAIISNCLSPEGSGTGFKKVKVNSLRLGLWVLSNLMISFFVSFGAQGIKLFQPDALLWIDRLDPFHRQRGWDQFDSALAALNKPSSIPWGVSDRDSAARILHRYGDDQIVYRPLPGSKPNHFVLRYPYPIPDTEGLAEAKGKCVWFVAKKGAADQAPLADVIARVDRPRLSGRSEAWLVWTEHCK